MPKKPIARSARKPAAKKIAKKEEYYLQGAIHHGTSTHSGNRLAREMFKKAIDEDEEYERALSFLAYAQLTAHLQDWRDVKRTEDNDATLAHALNNSAKAMDAMKAKKLGNDYEVLWTWAAVNLFMGEHKVAIDTYNAALKIAEDKKATPENISTLRVERADALMFKGGQKNIEDAIEIVSKEIEVEGPKHKFQPRKTHHWTRGWAYYELAFYDGVGDLAKQQEYAQKSLKELLQFRNPGPLIQKNIIASYSLLGWKDTARQLAKELRPQLPQNYTVDSEAKWPFLDREEERFDRFRNHLKEAGLP